MNPSGQFYANIETGISKNKGIATYLTDTGTLDGSLAVFSRILDRVELRLRHFCRVHSEGRSIVIVFNQRLLSAHWTMLLPLILQ